MRGSRRGSARSAALLRGNKGASEPSAVLLHGDKDASEPSADKNMSNKPHKRKEFMANKNLTTNYLTRLSNARSASRRVTLAIARTTTA